MQSAADVYLLKQYNIYHGHFTPCHSAALCGSLLPFFTVHPSADVYPWQQFTQRHTLPFVTVHSAADVNPL